MSNRIEYIDLVKGITIILVVVGHVETIPTIIKYAIYSFHMPLFFLISGYFFREDRSIKDYFKKLTKSLLVPYLFIAIIVRIYQIITDLYFGDPIDYKGILSVLGVVWRYEGDIVSVGAIWFLVVLFWAKLYLNVILRYSNGLTILILVAFVSIMLTKYADILLPFGLQQAFVCAVFLYIGLLCRKKDVFDIKISTSLIITITITALPFLSYFGIATRVNNYNYGLFSVLFSSVICIIVIWLIKRIDMLFNLGMVKTFFLWSGKYSIVILAVHNIEGGLVSPKILFPNYFIEILVRVLYIVISCWLILKIQLIQKVFNV